ncbi:MAG: M20/M25/M40 family metallo-hydrolase [Terriglobales bacterium]
MRSSARTAKIAAAGCLVTLALLAALQRHLQSPPAPLAADAPAAAFSAARAQALLAAWDTAPHPLGTPAHDRVRDAILAQLRALGLQGTISAGTSYLPLRGPQFLAGYVQNITAVLPGGEPATPAVMLVAHYDSVPRGVGAGDDGAGWAAMLESLRALRAAPPLRHDVIALFSDGEEAGMLGAARFVTHNPLAQRVGVVLNFEGRGNAGATAMFETSRHNGWLVHQLAAARTGARADSLMYAIYQRLPNDTDLSVFKRAGLPGMNFAYTQGFDYYHSPLDTPARLSPRTFQSQGAAMLAMARALGNAALSHPRAPDVVYFNPLGTTMVIYSFDWMNALAVLAIVLFVLACVFGLSRKQVTGSGLLAGAGLALLVLGACALSAPAIWRLLTWLHSGWTWIPQDQPYRPTLPALALLAWALFVASVLYIELGRRVSVVALGLGALFWWLVAAVGLVAALPGSAHPLLWPLLALLLAWMVLILWPAAGERAAFRQNGVLWMGAVPLALLLAPFAWTLLLTLPWSQAGAALAVFALALIALSPYVVRLGRRLPAAALALCVVLGAAGIARNRFTPDRARPDSIAFIEQLGAVPSAHWISYDPKPDVFTAQFLGAHPVYSDRAWRAPAPLLPLPGPQAHVAADSTRDGLRTLRLHLSSPSGAQQLRLVMAGDALPLAATLNGEPVHLDAPSARYPADARSWGFTYGGLPASGLDLVLTLRAGQPAAFTLTSARFGLPSIPGLGLHPRPPNVISAPFVATDSTIVSALYKFLEQNQPRCSTAERGGRAAVHRGQNRRAGLRRRGIIPAVPLRSARRSMRPRLVPPRGRFPPPAQTPPPASCRRARACKNVAAPPSAPGWRVAGRPAAGRRFPPSLSCLVRPAQAAPAV